MADVETIEDKGTFLLELYRKALTLNENELYEYFLDNAVKVTKSAIGFFHFVTEDQKTTILTTWNKEALKNCTANFNVHYPIEEAGNWADCIREKRAIIYNDFKQSPNQKGLPKGHVPISRILSIPIIENDKVYGIFGVGNKELPYTDNDVVQLEVVGNEFYKIMKQRLAESEVKESREKYRLLFQNMIDGFAYCRMIFNEKNIPIDFEYLEINDAFERLTGLKREAVVGKRVTEAIPSIKSANPELLEIYGRVALTSKEEKFEVFFKPLNLWLSISVYCPMKGFFAAVFEDITDRKKAEGSLLESEERFSKAFHVNPTAMAIASVDGKMVDINGAYERLLGFSRDEVIGKHVVNLGLYAELPEREGLVRELNEKGRVSDYEISFRHKSGRPIRVIFSLERIILQKKPHFLGTAIDVTERKRAEEALKESEERLKRSQEIAHLGSWELDLTNNKLIWSDEVYRIFGLKPQEFGATYNAFLDYVHPADRSNVDYAYSGSLADGRDSYEIEHRIVRKNTGEIRFVHEKCAHFRDTSGKIIRSVGMVQDITERQQLEQQLEQYTKHLEKLVDERTKQLKDAERLAAIGATAGMVGHDIRNPLQAITSDVYLLKAELDPMPEGEEKSLVKESLDGIEKNVDYINKIVLDLQDFAKPLNPHTEETDLKLIIDKLLRKNDLPENIKVSIKVENNAEKVVADSSYLNRIMYNLVINAVQAMPNGGELTILAYKVANHIVIAVKDTGVGIPEKVKGKLFTPMFTTKSKGQGFGLAVIKRMTEALGGTVTFDSQEGKGTTFIVKLPSKK